MQKNKVKEWLYVIYCLLKGLGFLVNVNPSPMQLKSEILSIYKISQ